MTLESSTDNSNFIPGSDRRVIRGTIRIKVEGWLTPPIIDTPLIKPVITMSIPPDDLPDMVTGV